MKFILIGCGLLTGLFILGMGSCGGVMYFVYKGTDPVAAIGADYLRRAPELQTHYGPPVVVRRHKLGWKVQVVNDGGNARISYDVSGASVTAPGEAVVWLIRSGGKWSPVGATARTPDGYSVTIGKPPAEHRIHLDD